MRQIILLQIVGPNEYVKERGVKRSRVGNLKDKRPSSERLSASVWSVWYAVWYGGVLRRPPPTHDIQTLCERELKLLDGMWLVFPWVN